MAHALRGRLGEGGTMHTPRLACPSGWLATTACTPLVLPIPPHPCTRAGTFDAGAVVLSVQKGDLLPSTSVSTNGIAITTGGGGLATEGGFVSTAGGTVSTGVGNLQTNGVAANEFVWVRPGRGGVGPERRLLRAGGPRQQRQQTKHQAAARTHCRRPPTCG